MVSAASLVMGCAPLPDSGEVTREPSAGEAQSAATGTTIGPLGLVNVHSGPGPQYGMVYQLPTGNPITVVCTATGTLYEGSPYWYRLPDGNYVSSRRVSIFEAVPNCPGS